MLGSAPLDASQFQDLVKTRVNLRLGPFSVGLTIRDPEVARDFFAIYGDYQFEPGSVLPDFRISLIPHQTLWNWKSKQVKALIGDEARFAPMPRHLGYPMLESAINFCIGTSILRALIIHAAVVERDGRAIVMPGYTGSGKSTLTAALISKGWRLLSDEIAIIDLNDGSLLPYPRAISLKNNAIDLIIDRCPDLTVSRRYEGTLKGTLAFVKAPLSSVQYSDRPARPSIVLAPRYEAGSQSVCRRIENSEAFMLLVKQSPNYKTLSARGFHALSDFVESSVHYRMRYSDLDEAIETVEQLSQSHETDVATA